jgi:hypothetical protein
MNAAGAEFAEDAEKSKCKCGDSSTPFGQAPNSVQNDGMGGGARNLRGGG